MIYCDKYIYSKHEIISDVLELILVILIGIITVLMLLEALFGIGEIGMMIVIVLYICTFFLFTVWNLIDDMRA